MKWELAWIDDTVRAWKKKNGSYICDYKEDDGVAYEFSHINMESKEIREINKTKLSYYRKKEFYIPSGVLRFELNDDKALFSLKAVEVLVELEKADKVVREFLDSKNGELERQAAREKEVEDTKADLSKNIVEIKALLSHIERGVKDDINEIKSFLNYVKEVKSHLALGNFNVTPKNIQVKHENKEQRKEEYREKINKYVADKQSREEKITIRSLTKDLKINRKTLYNLGLNECLKELLNK